MAHLSVFFLPLPELWVPRPFDSTQGKFSMGFVMGGGPAFPLISLLEVAPPLSRLCDRAGTLISCPACIPMRKVMQRKSNSPPCLCKKRRDKDGAAARVN